MVISRDKRVKWTKFSKTSSKWLKISLRQTLKEFVQIMAMNFSTENWPP